MKTRTRTRLVGLAATLLVAGLLIGLPATLLALDAGPIPHALPTLEQVRAALSTPDDGTLALRAITLIGWVAWAVLAGSILLEIGSRLRGVHAPHLPGLHLPQLAAGQLVNTAALLFVVLPTTGLAGTGTPTPAAATPRATATEAVTTVTPAASATTTANQAPAGTYTVRAGDTLWDIAARRLGDPHRWPELARLNPTVAGHPDVIHPGTLLRLPEEPAPAPPRTYTVKAGDTLTGIAHRELGDAEKYPLIFQASKNTIQPGGVRLSNPDRIDVGQTLTIPGTNPGPAPAPPTREPTATTPTATTLAPQTLPAQRPDAGELAPSRAAPATVSPVPAGASQSTPAAGEVDTARLSAPWMLAGLSGGGALLGGSLLLLLRARRRAQFRGRRPGSVLAGPQQVLGPVEKTITAVGELTAPTVEHLDAVLRRLAAAVARDHSTLPALAAVELTGTHLVLHLAEAASLPEPWAGTADGHHWQITPDTDLGDIGPDVPDQPAPYPLLVTIGVSDTGSVWLLNVEDLDVSITGDPVYGQDVARHLVAELACNPWSAGVEVACVGVATELAALNPDRIHAYHPDQHHPGQLDRDPIGVYLAEAVHTVDRAHAEGLDVPTARARQTGADPWPARLLLVDAAAEHPALDQLLQLVHTQPGHTATCVVLAGQRPDTPGTVLQVTADGRVSLPEAGLNLVAVGLTSDEAHGCAALMAHSQTDTQVPVPVEGDATGGWRSFADQAGALRPEHTQPRTATTPREHTHQAGEDTHQPDEDTVPTASSLLDHDDATYTRVAATTTEDLQILAPQVPDTIRAAVEQADPTLDDELAMWFHPDSALPKLHLLGPVHATTRGKPLTKRKPYMTELLTFIALRRLGATPEEVADTFTITTPKARDYVLTIRQWLGTNPRTGQPHLPDARTAPAAQIRGVPVYQIIDLLIDIDLFRRLRVRGQTRGPAGIGDLRTALTLVQGRPFHYPIDREAGGGWTWLHNGDRLDEHMTVAIVDVAHTVTTHALATGDLPTARLAAETAALAAPHEEIPRLDLAAVAAAEGHHAEAQRIIRDDICNRTDDDGPPPQLSTRTAQILTQRQDRPSTKVS